MRPFVYSRVRSLDEAVRAAGEPGAVVLAGGTTLVDLMRLEVMRPRHLVDIGGLGELRAFDTGGPVLRFGALANMADVAEDPVLARDHPALTESLRQAASQQLRNVATLGGNILQRTRCAYFRDGVSPCNKRSPGTGCAALTGVNREHAVLGATDACIAVYPGDWGVALAAFDTEVELVSAHGRRTLPFEHLHRAHGDRPDLETVLRPGEIVTAITVRATPAGRRSVYLKVRDRASYAFAVASAAVALEMAGATVVGARVAVGGVATRPWRSREAEAELTGRPLTEETARSAGRAAFAHARALSGNTAKLRLGPRTVAEAVMLASRKGQDL
ncbi:xanthine dehydrogenase family protein subunit M [Streptomyces sp. ISL-11]|uniref:FAD binding domain-containing protein n=1 Tax=Streptomyces sp. ISL-11 TaxID=2819174 RepID=UPI001BE4E24D|nr:xanthine dehydrogenase family protein subunit M [Streptomyces sp. ISL-11]MBT2385703.1 xanthine dehydrogenase family protein subunit M [Streptomyces sp. ISL-11]